jgi:hypothetical protein
MNNKAQFYILTAVILLAITFGLFASKKTVEKPSGTFDSLVDNYLREAPLAANSGNLNDFTLKFYDFAKTKDNDFEMLYFYTQGGAVSSLSLVKSTIFINQYNISFNQSIVFDNIGEAVVSTGTAQYTINTTNDGLRAVFFSQKQGSRNVRTA